MDLPGPFSPTGLRIGIHDLGEGAGNPWRATSGRSGRTVRVPKHGGTGQTSW